MQEEFATGMTAILAAGSPPSHEVPMRIFREAERLIACDGAWRTAMELGRRPDAVVGDGDSLGDEGREELARLGIPFVCDREQDTNDLCKAVMQVLKFESSKLTTSQTLKPPHLLTSSPSHLLTSSPSHLLTGIVILGATGKREDHALGNIFHLIDFAERPCGVAMVTDAGVFEPVLPPGRTWDAWAGQPVSVFAPLPGTEMESEGLQWALKGVDLSALWRGTLNRAVDGPFTVRTNKPAIIFLPHLQSGGVFWYISHLLPT